MKYSPKLLPSVKDYEDFNERSVIVDVLSGRALDITEKDPISSDFNIEKEIVVKGPYDIQIEERLEMLAKFRAYRKSLESLSTKIEKMVEKQEKIEKEIKELKITLLFDRRRLLYFEEEHDEVVSKNKGSMNKGSIYKSELKRIRKLTASLKVYGLWDRMGMAGGEVSIDLCRFLRSGVECNISELDRFLPP